MDSELYLKYCRIPVKLIGRELTCSSDGQVQQISWHLLFIKASHFSASTKLKGPKYIGTTSPNM